MKQLKLILVDDNNAFREALKILAEYKYHAIILDEASSASEVLKLENLHLADIIFIDVMMPEMNGIELAKELLRKHHSFLKIVAITMHADKVYLQPLIEAGFKGCIFKNDIVKQFGEATMSVMNNQLFFPDSILLSNDKKLNNQF